MTIIDSHTHLFSDKFNPDIDQVVQRAMDQGVQEFILPNINLSTIPAMLNLAKKYPGQMHPSIGLHPCDVKADYREHLIKIKKHLSESPDLFCAIGETGLDLYWDKETLPSQLDAFEQQISWAKEYNKPIIIHARESFDQLFEVLDKLNDESLRGVFHCFTGNVEQARKILAYKDFKLGIGGVLTFKNSGLDKVIEQIELEHFLLETDSPYLAPVPHRGKRNESSFIVNIAEKLASIHQKKLSEVASITTQNTRELFSLTKLN